jgi:hypothetical protein
MLSEVPVDGSVPTQEHDVFQLLIGTRGSFTAAHTDYYGAEAYIYLVEGKKLWFMAPPESKDVFMKELFKHNVPCSTPSKERTQAYKDAGIQAVIQNAGDTVFVPSGWVHCVKNLTDTIAIGHSYIRPWSLKHTLTYLEQQGEDEERAKSIFNIDGIFATVMEGNWGLFQEELTDIQERWQRLKQTWHKKRSQKVQSKNVHLKTEPSN